MLIKLAKIPPSADVLTLARTLCEDGKAAIRVASDLLRANRDSSVRET